MYQDHANKPLHWISVANGMYTGGDGHATAHFANGDMYCGQWKAVTYHDAGGDEYVGEWKADEREGRGTMEYAGGSVRRPVEGGQEGGARHVPLP